MRAHHLGPRPALSEGAVHEDLRGYVAFISRAAFGKGVDACSGYPVPYRCFYSKDIDNLFMAGRCISVNHDALGTIRVMRTCGMMGEVVGKAAYLCVRHETTPRGVYDQYLDNLKELMSQPGAMRRDNIEGQLYLPKDAAKLPDLTLATAGAEGSIPLNKMEGIVIDDEDAELTGKWATGQGLQPYNINKGYATLARIASARFPASRKPAPMKSARLAAP